MNPGTGSCSVLVLRPQKREERRRGRAHQVPGIGGIVCVNGRKSPRARMTGGGYDVEREGILWHAGFAPGSE